MSPIAFDTSANDTSLFNTDELINYATKETVKSFLIQEEQPQHIQQEHPKHQVPQQEDNEANKECATNINDIEKTTDSHNSEEKLLKENEDYETVSRAVNVLKFQLQQVKEDICKLKSMKEKALKDPIQFVEDLRNGTNEKVPKRQFIFGAPTIDWSKYHTTPSKYKARIDQEKMKNSKDRVNTPPSSDNSRSGSPDIVEFVHKRAQELGFKVPSNAIKSTRSKKKRINLNSDDESTFTIPSRTYINAQRSTLPKSRKKEMSIRTAPTKARSLISNCSTRQDMIAKNTNYSSNSIHTNRKNNLEKNSEAGKKYLWNYDECDKCQRHFIANQSYLNLFINSGYKIFCKKLAKYGILVPGRIPSVSSAKSSSKNILSKDKKSGRISKSDSSKLPPEKRPRRPRVSGIAYMEARPPPTLYMPDDDDETIIKEVMLSMDKLGNEPKCDGCRMDPILGTRFLCMNCDESREVDLCENCMIEGKFENGII
ncbi:19360_t:CDS:10 [Dentiscutata erythropus]|uniref:19360_t:CDS:1 n=1 Tax=Dentiscutata erythropus TaxID=1348616 RepID=A0A9N8WUR6_9GLOM|nr:19360_t:CDS:10 [Dentiscutata erythropus]